MERLSKEEKLKLKNENKILKKERMKKRITELDFIRGLAIMIMILDHVVYDFGYLLPKIFKNYPSYDEGFWTDLFYFAKRFWNWQVREDVRYFVLFIFLALTGISCSFSRSNLKRGVKLFAFSCLLTLVTYIFGQLTNSPNNTIIFGIIHCISISIILVALMEKFDYGKWTYLSVGLFMIILGAYILFINPKVRRAWYGSEPLLSLLFKAILGIYDVGSDCYSLLFFGGQVFIGVFLGKLLYKDRKSLIIKGDYKNNFITVIGRHSLIIYLLHQIILPVILSIIMLFFGFELAI